MPDLTVYRMCFHSGLHVGGPRDNPAESIGMLPADTLFAALVDMWRRTGGDPVAFAAPFVEQPADAPFLLTSAFPFAGDVRFYPMPVDRGALFSHATLEDRGKSVRRIAYLSEGLLKTALQGEPMDRWLFPKDEGEEPMTGVALQGGRYWLKVDEIAGLPKDMRRDKTRRHALAALAVDATTRTPRVTLDRLSSASQIYHVGRTVFAEGCGLWFGVAWRDPARPVAGDGRSYAEVVRLLFAMLADEGVGGDRTSGYGALTLTVEEKPVRLPDAGPGHTAWLLSRYHPARDEEYAALGQGAYTLVTIGGRLHSPDQAAQRRRKLVMLAEGSRLPATPVLPVGSVADVRPRYEASKTEFPHPVYRYGLALAVGRREGTHG